MLRCDGLLAEEAMTNQTSQKTFFNSNPYLELNYQGKIQRLELTNHEHRLGRDRSWADLVVPSDWTVMSSRHAILRKQGEDYLIIDGDGNKRSTNKIYANYILIPTDGYHLKDGTELQSGQDSSNWIVLDYYNTSNIQAAPAPAQRFISLSNGSAEVGREPQGNNVLKLDAPIISRRHATIDRDNQGRYILHDYSTNGVWVNGQKVNGAAVLVDGAMIRIGPFSLILQGDRLEVQDMGDRIRLDAENLVIPKRLQSITLPIMPGQFVALVGGSGAGKSTLMKTLLGIEKTTSGKVYLNGDDLQKNFNLYRTYIGYVPQSDILHRDLKVAEVLSYAAKLRLPPDTTDIDVRQKVEETLKNIEMSHKKDALVRNLSGGQLKRVSIGVELLADPKLFFLDEPTSGLDPGLDKKMMQLLRRLANQGRTVVLVTHATANINECDRIAFLGRGGYVCYFGTPDDALKFFGITNDDFADIYIQLEADTDAETEKLVQKCANKFSTSSYCGTYVTQHLQAGKQQGTTSPPKKASINPFKQLALLSKRYFNLIVRNQVYLGLSLLTAPIGIGLITLAIRDKNPLFPSGETDATLAPLALRVLFVFTCAAIWVGFSSSLQEIVKESAIYLRERLVNLGLFPYLGSKVLILGGLAVLQSLLMALVILIGFKSPTPDLISWPVGLTITSFLTLFTSMSLGLLVSASVKDSSQANSALPLLLLPQIIFSGVLFKMEGIARIFSWLMLSRWSVGAYGSLVNVNAMLVQTTLPDGSKPPLPFDKVVYEATWHNLSLNWVILLLHAAVYLTATFWIQKRKDIF